MKSFSIVCVAGVAAAALAGCTSAPPSGGRAAKPKPVERASQSQPYDFRSEGRIPPLAPGDAANEPDVEEIGVKESAIEVSEADAPADTSAPTPEPAPGGEALVDGFRVQVFATADREIAENASRLAGQRLGLPAYVDLDGGMYKVRVGDFTTRPGADQALAGIRRHYADAWVVTARVPAVRSP